MNILLLGIVLLDVAFDHSPTAECMDMIDDKTKATYSLGMWEKGAEDHQIGSSTDGVYVVTENLLVAKKFMYDGKGPWAQFLASKTDKVDNTSETCMPYMDGGGVMKNASYALKEYKGDKDVLIMLPTDMKFADMKGFGVFCRKAGVLFASIKLPPATPPTVPMTQDVGEFQEPDAASGLKGKVMVLSSRAIQIDEFTFDPKELKECFFTAGMSEKPDETGEKLSTAMEETPAPISKPYTAQKIMIKLPEGKGVCMFKWFAIWDAANKKSLGWVKFDSEKWVIPPEMGQNLPSAGGGGSTEGPSSETPEPSSDMPSSEETSPETDMTSAETEPTPPRSPEPEPAEETTTEKGSNSITIEPSFAYILAAAVFIQFFCQQAKDQVQRL